MDVGSISFSTATSRFSKTRIEPLYPHKICLYVEKVTTFGEKVDLDCVFEKESSE